MVDPSKESNKHGSGHCTKMQAILRQVSDGECVGVIQEGKRDVLTLACYTRVIKTYLFSDVSAFEPWHWGIPYDPMATEHRLMLDTHRRYLHRFQPKRRWYVVTDDDTLVNVPRLLRVLDSHDDSLAIYLGERYGWSHMQDSGWAVWGDWLLVSMCRLNMLHVNLCHYFEPVISYPGP